MPTYDYICDETGEVFEYFQGINEEPLEYWPKDVEGYDPEKPKKVRRKIGTGIGLMFKGSGFYETDYVKKSNGSGKEGPTSSNSNTSENKATKKKSSE